MKDTDIFALSLIGAGLLFGGPAGALAMGAVTAVTFYGDTKKDQ